MNYKTLKLVTWLQDNTNLSEILISNGINTSPTENNANGSYAVIERWLTEKMSSEDSINNLF